MIIRSLIVAAGIVCPALAAGTCPELAGEAVEGGLLWGATTPGTAVTLDDEAIDVTPDGQFVFGFHRDAKASSMLRVGDDCLQAIGVRQRDYRIQRVEGVPQQTVTPPPEQLERIRRERALVRSAKAQRIARPDWLMQVSSGFQWPVLGPISGVYGSQRIYNGTPGNPHYGVDVAVPRGTPVRAPAAGRVTLAEPDLFYSGGTVIVDHGYGLSSSFLHMSEVAVRVGEEVAVGDVIGAVGATGRATGPHLDWRMSWRDRRVDPALLVPAMPPLAGGDPTGSDKAPAPTAP